MNLKRFILPLTAMVFCTVSAVAETGNLASIFTNTTSTAGVHRTFGRDLPSIIYIACNGLALGDLSCYGQTNFVTPNIDRLATEGMRFTNYRLAGDDPATVQAALLDGNNAPFSAGQPTLASHLRQAGYYTGLVGEWMLDSQPGADGFDQFIGFVNEREADNYYSDFTWRQTPTMAIRRVTIFENAGNKKATFIPDLMMGTAGNFVRINVPDNGNHHRPFFLVVDLPLPHSLTPGKDDYVVPTDAPYGDEKWPQAAKNRAALVTRLDDHIGRLLEQLGKLGMTNNVAVFFTGAAAPEKFADSKLDFLTLKDEVRGGTSDDRLRVPMLVRWPGHIPPGHISNANWSTMDFAPTVLELANAKPASSMTGTSILTALLGK